MAQPGMMQPGMMQPGMMQPGMGGMPNQMGAMGMMPQQGFGQMPPIPQPQQPAMLQPQQAPAAVMAATPAAPTAGFAQSLEASLGLAPPSVPAAPPAQPAQPAAADPFAAQPAQTFDVSDPFANPTPSAPIDTSDPFSNPVAPPAPPAAAEEEEEEEDAPEGQPGEVALSTDQPEEKKGPTVLSRQDTFKYLEELANGAPQVKVDAARALKSLAFNANAEYKEGLLKGGVPRLLMVMISDASSTAALEQATSCMYSMAREHMDSKMALVKACLLYTSPSPRDS